MSPLKIYNGLSVLYTLASCLTSLITIRLTGFCLTFSTGFITEKNFTFFSLDNHLSTKLKFIKNRLKNITEYTSQQYFIPTDSVKTLTHPAARTSSCWSCRFSSNYNGGLLLHLLLTRITRLRWCKICRWGTSHS
jgi:hypothetical protein